MSRLSSTFEARNPVGLGGPGVRLDAVKTFLPEIEPTSLRFEANTLTATPRTSVFRIRKCTKAFVYRLDLK